MRETKEARAARLAAKRLDAEINDIYCRECSGIQIDILEIPHVFAAGRKAASEGRSVRDAVVAYVEAIRKN